MRCDKTLLIWCNLTWWNKAWSLALKKNLYMDFKKSAVYTVFVWTWAVLPNILVCFVFCFLYSGKLELLECQKLRVRKTDIISVLKDNLAICKYCIDCKRQAEMDPPDVYFGFFKQSYCEVDGSRNYYCCSVAFLSFYTAKLRRKAISIFPFSGFY